MIQAFAHCPLLLTLVQAFHKGLFLLRERGRKIKVHPQAEVQTVEFRYRCPPVTVIAAPKAWLLWVSSLT